MAKIGDLFMKDGVAYKGDRCPYRRGWNVFSACSAYENRPLGKNNHFEPVYYEPRSQW